jgi:aryl-alcohol dehydrogenase-like predicted oxidoreductase
MKTRALGKNGFSIGEVGLGCWQFGGDFGAMEQGTADEIMSASLESGVDFFDTANVYGGGRSEEWIGKFLSTRKGRIVVATKYGRGPDAYPDRYTEEGLRRAIDESRARLRVETIDLLQLHCIPDAVLRAGEVFDWLRRAQVDGLIRHFGASVETVEEGIFCLGQQGLLSLQIIFNLFRQKPAEELLPRAKERGVGIIVRLPLASGLLSGRFTAATTFSDTDHRNYNRDGAAFNVGETFAGLPLGKGAELAAELKSLVPSGMTMAQMAMRWILDHDAVSVIIPGASSVAQAKENAAVSALPSLSQELHAELSAFYREKVREHIRGPY